MKNSLKAFAVVLAAVFVVGIVVAVVLRHDSPKAAPVASQGDKLYNPDATINIKLHDFTITSGQTEFTVKQSVVTKLQFFVDEDEELIHLTGPGVDTSTETDGTSPSPGSIFVKDLAPGTYELSAYPDTAEGIAAQPEVKHVLGHVVVAK